MDSNPVFRMLFSGPKALVWSDILPNEELELRDVSGRGSGIFINPFPLFGNYPRYTDTAMMTDFPADEAVLGLTMHAGNAPRGSGRFIYAPGLVQVDDRITHAFSSADLLLVDGTFWSEDELCATIGRSASQMGHLPISGAHGILESLAELKPPKRVFIHVNNTNPILDEDSPEYQQVRAAGWEIAEDGMEFNL
jgi:pyrroloquinoline quinone biosynthesis protein B